MASQRARSEAFDLASIVRSCPSEVSASDSPALRAWPIPMLSADGGCSLGKTSPEPFHLLEELAALSAGESASAANVVEGQQFRLRRLWVLKRVCEALANVTGAEWVGVYQVVPPSSRYESAGGSSAAHNLLKLAYVGAPSRPLFPLTAEFAETSNNSAVALSGNACIIHDVRRLPRDAPYYVCDGKVRSEACVPICDASGSVIGLIDAESFAPEAFAPAALLGAVLGAASALGAADLCRAPSSLEAQSAWRAGVTATDLNRGAEELANEARLSYEREPLVGENEEISALAVDYIDNPAFNAKFADLEKRYSSFRKIRGDGNCFYRALLVSIGLALARGRVSLLPSDSAPPLQKFFLALLARVKHCPATLVATGQFPSETTGDFFDALTAYLEGLAGASSDADAEARALAPLRPDADGSPMGSFFILYAMRLICACELLCGGDYADLVFASSTLPIKEFVDAEVTPAGVEADFIQILALARGLGVAVRIASIDASSKGDKVAINTLPDDGGELVPLVLDLLYRPGHYDVITPRNV